MSRRAARCTQADIHRALRAMAQAGVKGAVEVDPDGTLRIIPEDHRAPETTDPPKLARPGRNMLS